MERKARPVGFARNKKTKNALKVLDKTSHKQLIKKTDEINHKRPGQAHAGNPYRPDCHNNCPDIINNKSRALLDPKETTNYEKSYGLAAMDS